MSAHLRKRRGALLIGALCLIVFMAVLAAHLFHSLMVDEQTSTLKMYEVTAFEAAQAGLDDARIKLSKCFTYVSLTLNQKAFVYSHRLGPNSSFEVIIEPLGSAIRVTSRGFAGPTRAVIARRQLMAVFDGPSGTYKQFADWGSL